MLRRRIWLGVDGSGTKTILQGGPSHATDLSALLCKVERRRATHRAISPRFAIKMEVKDEAMGMGVGVEL